MEKSRLINFLKQEKENNNIMIFCYDNEFADRLLKLINQRSDETKAVRQNEQKKNKCKHASIRVLQGGQVEQCRRCGKEWS